MKYTKPHDAISFLLHWLFTKEEIFPEIVITSSEEFHANTLGSPTHNLHSRSMQFKSVCAKNQVTIEKTFILELFVETMWIDTIQMYT